MSSRERSRRFREERGSLRCEELSEGSSLFIAAGGRQGAAAKATMATRLQRASELGEGAALFRVSRRSSWPQRRD
jgi:hypothetical protein